MGRLHCSFHFDRFIFHVFEFTKWACFWRIALIYATVWFLMEIISQGIIISKKIMLTSRARGWRTKTSTLIDVPWRAKKLKTKHISLWWNELRTTIEDVNIHLYPLLITACNNYAVYWIVIRYALYLMFCARFLILYHGLDLPYKNLIRSTLSL